MYFLAFNTLFFASNNVLLLVANDMYFVGRVKIHQETDLNMMQADFWKAAVLQKHEREQQFSFLIYFYFSYWHSNIPDNHHLRLILPTTDVDEKSVITEESAIVQDSIIALTEGRSNDWRYQSLGYIFQIPQSIPLDQ